MSNNSLLVVGCVALAVLFFHHEKRTPVAEAETPVQAEAQPVFDYGDGVGAAPDTTTPIPAFGSNQQPVIDGPTAVVNPNGPSAFEDVPKGDNPPESKPTKSAFESTKSNIGDFVFPIKCHTGAGSAVAVAPDTLVSAYHVALYAKAQISLASGVIDASVQHPPGADSGWKDAALLKVPGGQFPSLKCRAANYREAVTVYGQATKTPMRGFVVGQRAVSLDAASTGVKNGDSGGAIMADSDGCLVGIISGAEGKNQNYQADNRVVMMTRIEYVLPYLPQSTKVASQVPKPVGSVFPEADAVNRNQSRPTGPASPGNGWEAFNRPVQVQPVQVQPQQPQSNQQGQQFYYSVPSNGRGRMRWFTN